MRDTRLASCVALLLLVGCGREQASPRFRELSPRRTGITFANTITTNDAENVQNDAYVYNGAGVAVGDIDNDGRPDIFFAGNMVSSRLYRNNGDLRFEDITERAGVATKRWATGATMGDINDDGYLDIYVSMSGPPWSKPEDRANLLFINNGNGTFTEAARSYGVADTGFTTHAALLDYNRDGYLDLFLLNNSPKDFVRGEVTRHPAGILGQTPGSYNQLYRNNGDGTFTNVSKEAGILRDAGYGLGVAVCDFNGDGWPDIYVSNDDGPNDVLYINNRDGTFTNQRARSLKHTSYAGMGVDCADFNNDGLPDVLQVDMMPAALSRRKLMSGHLTYDGLLEARSRGFRDDYDMNSLQLNNGLTSDGVVTFSDIARLAGIAYTDWSWSALFADFDNDGYKDIFITNGYPKAVTDFDYQAAMFRIGRSADSASSHRTGREILKRLPALEFSNYLFRNEGDLTFGDSARAWGMNRPGFSYGAAYADLNNDGQLDLVVNNIDAPASIYENVPPRTDTNHYLTVELRGQSPNRRAIGSHLILTAGGQRQYLYHSPYRGYMSTMDDREHFGLGHARRVDSLAVIWPDGRCQVLSDLAADRTVTVQQEDAQQAAPGTGCRASGSTPWHPAPDSGHLPFRPANPGRALPYKHQAGSQVDYRVQPLLPYMLSRQGPPLAVADVNADGMEDVFIGGAAGVPGKLFLQRRDGSFAESARRQPWAADSAYEDWGALFFDANQDGRPDLYVASCGYQLAPISRLLQDRLYMNAGGGRFVRDSQALPAMPTCTAAVAAADFTGDGRMGLFVGGRLTPRNYPYPTRSYLLRNTGGRFVDVTAEWAPELLHPGGMVTAAVWIDLDGDGRPDLVTAGEWMPIQFYHNDGTRLRNITASVGLPPLRGWWYSLAVGDFNHDGRPDLVAGNLGLNAMYVTSPQSRFGVYAASFTGNQTTDIILTQESDGREFPYFGRARLGPSIYPLALRYPTYASFATASIDQLFGAPVLQRAQHYQADLFASVYLQNNGDGTFTAVPLPALAQISTIRAIVAHDVDGDGNLDVIVAGNLYDTDPSTPPADAGDGLWLKGDGRGHFTAVPAAQSGFRAPRDVTGMALMKTPAGSTVLVANNGDSLQAFVIRRR